MKHRLLEVTQLRELAQRLDGRGEFDDAYLGGERSGGKRGRGSESTAPFLAAVQTTTGGKPVVACFARQPFTRVAVAAFAARSLAGTAHVGSNGLACSGTVAQVGAPHERVVTGGGPASVKLPQFTAINTVLGNLKTALAGTYRAFDFAKYAHRYVAEV